MRLSYKNWKCNKCNMVFDTRALLTKHRKSHNENHIWKCNVCGTEFSSRRKLALHRKGHYELKSNEIKHNNFHPKIFGVCEFCNKEFYTTPSALSLHKRICKLNPNRRTIKRKKLDEKTRSKISSSMKLAILEGRAHGWANSKSNKFGMSYPEIWFKDMLIRNGLDGNFEYNKQFFQYKLDFAWTEKRLCIEIDGSQHYLLNERIESDKKKDLLLKKYGWKLLRLKWGFIKSHTVEAIEIVKSFLNATGDITVPLYKTKAERNNERMKYNESNGILRNSIGRFSPQKNTEEEWLKRKSMILESNVDISKFGWVNKVYLATGLSRRSINLTVKHFPDLKKIVYFRRYKTKVSGRRSDSDMKF